MVRLWLGIWCFWRPAFTIAAAAGLAAKAASSAYKNKQERDRATESRDWQAHQAEVGREFNLNTAATAHQREVEDLRAAGLNPVLSGTGGHGSQVGSISAPGGGPAGVQGMDLDPNAAMREAASAKTAKETTRLTENQADREESAVDEQRSRAGLEVAKLYAAMGYPEGIAPGDVLAQKRFMDSPIYRLSSASARGAEQDLAQQAQDIEQTAMDLNVRRHGLKGEVRDASDYSGALGAYEKRAHRVLGPVTELLHGASSAGQAYRSFGGGQRYVRPGRSR